MMDAYDLLPVHNFQYGKHPDTPKIDSLGLGQALHAGHPRRLLVRLHAWRARRAADGHVVRTGPYKGDIVTVDGPEYENVAGLGSNCGIFDPDWLLEVNFYCDTYGIDTISFGTLCAFVMECWRARHPERGADRRPRPDAGATPSRSSSCCTRWRAARASASSSARASGSMKKLFAENAAGATCSSCRDIGMENKGLEYSQYMSKESLAQQGGYGLTNKGPQHDEAWLIFMDMVNNQIPTFEDKAEALHYFPLFRTWFGLHGLCKLPWNDIEPADNAEHRPSRPRCPSTSTTTASSSPA